MGEHAFREKESDLKQWHCINVWINEMDRLNQKILNSHEQYPSQAIQPNLHNKMVF